MKYEFIGWAQDEKTNTDKVWGVICISDAPHYWDDSKYVSFWGRRGKKLSTKLHECTGYAMARIWEKKHKDGYTKIHEQRLTEVYPEFQEDLEKTAMWAILCS